MITRGSKFFFSAAGVAYLSALLFGFITASSASGGVLSTASSGGGIDAIVGPITFGWKGSVGDHVGYTVLMTFAAAMAVIGSLTTATRDADVSVLASANHTEVDNVAAPAQPIGYSIWPLFAAVSAALIVVGLAFSTFLLYVGLIGLAAAALEWVVRSWSESTSGATDSGESLRGQILTPVELPVVVALVIGVVAVAVSRVLLAIPKNAAVFVIIGLAIVFFALLNLLARRRELTKTVVAVVLVVSAVVLIVAGIAAGISGTREIEEHEEEHAISAVVGQSKSITAGTDGY